MSAHVVDSAPGAIEGPGSERLDATPFGPEPPGRAHRPGGRLLGIDGLRFIAALAVMLHHFTSRWTTAWGRPPEEVWPTLGEITAYAAVGPELFFVISGFAILMTAWGRGVPEVLASRVSRLYPAYWAGVILTSGLLLVIWRDGKRITLAEAAVNVTMLQSLFGVRHVDGVYWTLWTELRFYALILLFVALGITRRRVLVVAALWPPVAIAAAALGVEPLRTVLLGSYAPLFAGGMVLYLIYRDGHGVLPWALVAANTVLAARFVAPGVAAMIERNTAFVANRTLVVALVVTCFVMVAVVTLTRLRSMPGAWLMSLGALTYPLYLLHEYWGWWVISLAHPGLGRYGALGAAVVVSVGLAVAVHYGVERRGVPALRAWVLRTTTALTAARKPVPDTTLDEKGTDDAHARRPRPAAAEGTTPHRTALGR